MTALTREPIFRLPTTWSTALSGLMAVHHFEGEVTVREMNQIQEIGDAWHARYPGKHVALSIVYPSTNRPPPEQRERMRQLLKHWEHHHAAAANVMLIEGLLGAMHRSVFTGVLMMIPPPHPTKIFARIDDAIPWLLSYNTHAGLTVDNVKQAVDAVCAEFLARPGRVRTP